MTRFEPGEEPIYDDGGNLVAVGYTPSDAETVEEFWSDERLSELHEVNEAARALSPIPRRQGRSGIWGIIFA